jgi:hypothetical protein
VFVVTYFKYQRNQRRSALLVLLNISVVFIIWKGLEHYLPNYNQQKGVGELIEVLNIAAPIVMIILALLVIYLWVNNKTFTLQITPTNLDVNDPMFGDYSWSAKLKDIQKVGYTKEVQAELRRVHIFMQDGSSHQLTQNYRYSRSKFYQALHKAAPHIDIEESVRRFVKLQG